MDQIHQFINDPLVAPIYALLIVSFIDFLMAVYRSIQQHVFDWQKLPEILDSMVLSVVIPLAALGVAAYFVTDPTAKTGLQAAYVAAAAAALAGAVASLIRKLGGSYTATTKAQDSAPPTVLAAAVPEVQAPKTKAVPVTDGDIVLALDESSGRVHKRVRIANGYATLEGCNADQAGEWRIISPEELAALAADARCRRCFAADE